MQRRLQVVQVQCIQLEKNRDTNTGIKTTKTRRNSTKQGKLRDKATELQSGLGSCEGQWGIPGSRQWKTGRPQIEPKAWKSGAEMRKEGSVRRRLSAVVGRSGSPVPVPGAAGRRSPLAAASQSRAAASHGLREGEAWRRRRIQSRGITLQNALGWRASFRKIVCSRCVPIGWKIYGPDARFARLHRRDGLHRIQSQRGYIQC